MLPLSHRNRVPRMILALSKLSSNYNVIFADLETGRPLADGKVQHIIEHQGRKVRFEILCWRWCTNCGGRDNCDDYGDDGGGVPCGNDDLKEFGGLKHLKNLLSVPIYVIPCPTRLGGVIEEERKWWWLKRTSWTTLALIRDWHFGFETSRFRDFGQYFEGFGFGFGEFGIEK